MASAHMSKNKNNNIILYLFIFLNFNYSHVYAIRTSEFFSSPVIAYGAAIRRKYNLYAAN